jgi:hypothetical protein
MLLNIRARSSRDLSLRFAMRHDRVPADRGKETHKMLSKLERYSCVLNVEEGLL